MGTLSAAQAALADEAIQRVQASVNSAQSALDSESVVLTWITDSGSARAARQESLRQSKKILDQLRDRRPVLFAEDLEGFLQLASAGAQVDALLESARRMTGSGFSQEVVKPTLDAANPLNLSGPVGKLTALAVGILALLVVFNLTKD